ncbi:MAG: hypothetical protein QM405_02330 [Euryarchaeota archaeon]|jgi:hypothetical protein|nr:hypothetical protein [Euryarchaeota archaeon]
MDEKGFSFTPMAFLIMIPILLIAISFTGIVNEINAISQIAIGGDVTYTAANNIIISIEKGGKDAGRKAAYLATRHVIDQEALRVPNPFFATGQSKQYIKNITTDAINNNTVATCMKLEAETGRQIYINNVPINSYSDKPFKPSQITIDQTDPYSFNVNIPQGFNLTVTQKGQNATIRTPPITTTVSIEGLEDPYVWVKSKDRLSSIIYKYPYYTSQYNEYHLADQIYSSKLENLAACLNGTGNPSGITPRPYYFVDPDGLSFFDRLEGRSTSTEPSNTRMSTFVVGDPLKEEPGYWVGMSCVDHEYFTSVKGPNTITITNSVDGNTYVVRDYGAPGWVPVVFRLSDKYMTRLGLQSNYIFTP